VSRSVNAVERYGIILLRKPGWITRGLSPGRCQFVLERLGILCPRCVPDRWGHFHIEVYLRALTDGFLRAAKPPKGGRLEIADASCKGLTFRITAGGAKTWSYRYRVRNGGRVQRVTIGEYPEIKLGAARQSADAMRGTVAAGGNPAEEKRRVRVEANARSFEHLAQRYIVEHARRHKRSSSVAKDEQNLRLHVLPKWRNRDYRAIRRADVIELVEHMIATGRPVAANRVQSLVSTIFSFALDAALIEFHPCARLKRRAAELPSDRTLTDPEIRLFWRKIIDPEASIEARRRGLGLRLALLTGSRVGEIAGLSRDEVENIDSAARAAWLIPAARVKNKRDHLLPLPPLARKTVLELLALIEPSQSYLFPTRAKRGGPVRPNSFSKFMGHFALDLSGNADSNTDEVATWKAEPPTPHDLRRTVETRMAGLGVPKEYRDRVLNHISGGVGDRHYNRYDYASEKRDALTRWSNALAAVLGRAGGSVVPFTPTRRRRQ
jgi:integrase